MTGSYNVKCGPYFDKCVPTTLKAFEHDNQHLWIGKYVNLFHSIYQLFANRTLPRIFPIEVQINTIFEVQRFLMGMKYCVCVCLCVCVCVCVYVCTCVCVCVCVFVCVCV